jgi:phosphatidylserine/phosphatidylglycerophosphate/cardiolipin synthase-like enzyme
MQAYLLTSRPITDALVAARKRGIDVRVLMDGGSWTRTPRPPAPAARAGIRSGWRTAYRNAHNKVIVIDASLASATVITGSYNFTWSAQHKNAENMLVLGRIRRWPHATPPTGSATGRMPRRREARACLTVDSGLRPP